MRICEYERGFQDAMREAITWLHDEARRMNDPHAQRLLNSAGWSLGSQLNRPDLRARIARRERSAAQEVSPKPKRRSKLRFFVFHPDGAGEAIRTPDPNLGKVMLYP